MIDRTITLNVRHLENVEEVKEVFGEIDLDDITGVIYPNPNTFEPMLLLSHSTLPGALYTVSGDTVKL